MENNFFLLINHGKISVFVDGKKVVTDSKTRVFDKSLIQARLILKKIKENFNFFDLLYRSMKFRYFF